MPPAGPVPSARVRVSAIVVAHHAGEALGRCLDSLAGECDEAIVVDNGSGPELEAARARPGVLVVGSGENLGFPGGCNLGAQHASGDVLAFLNPDVVVSPGALRSLAGALADPEVGVVMPRVRLAAEPELLNTTGNALHVTGVAWIAGYRAPAESLVADREVPYASGAALAVRRDLFEEVGRFTDELFLYQEDLELCWRVRLRGKRAVLVAGADVAHDYDFERHGRKWYFLERNRLIFVWTAYSRRLLLLLLPLLVATEVGIAGFALANGWIVDKLRGWGWCIRHAAWIADRRRRTQTLRLVADRELARQMTAVLDPTVIAVPAVLRIVNPLVRGYWSLVSRAL